MKLLFANRKDTHIKYWMRHKSKTDFFSLHANFRLVNKMVFSSTLPSYIYMYINTYISKSFLLCWCELYLQRIRMKDVLCLWINILDVFQILHSSECRRFSFFSRPHSILNGLNMCSCICAHSCFRFNFIHMKNSILIIVMRQRYILLVTLYYSFWFVW